MTMSAKQKSNREAYFVDGGQKSEIVEWDLFHLTWLKPSSARSGIRNINPHLLFICDLLYICTIYIKDNIHLDT